MAKKGFDVTGVDFSLEGLRLAAERAMRAGVVARWMPADVRMMQMPDASFDGVLCNNILTLFIEGERGKVAGEIERVLAKGGALVVSERVVSGKPKNAREVEPGTFAEEEKSHLHHYFSKEELERLFAGVKFEKCEEKEEISEKEPKPHLLMAGFRK